LKKCAGSEAFVPETARGSAGGIGSDAGFAVGVGILVPYVIARHGQTLE
jgi:hypothetical protein